MAAGGDVPERGCRDERPARNVGDPLTVTATGLRVNPDHPVGQTAGTDYRLTLDPYHVLRRRPSLRNLDHAIRVSSATQTVRFSQHVPPMLRCYGRDYNAGAAAGLTDQSQDAGAG